MSARPDLTALIIEDEPRYRAFLADVLREMDCVSVVAGSADEARKHLAGSIDPDLVMLDLNLPGLGGLDFLEAFRQSHPETPVIILTGFGDLKAAKRSIRLGVTDFLSKPCELGQIEVAISRARQQILARRRPPSMQTVAEPIFPASTVRPLADLEREAIFAALRSSDGNRSEAARGLGISRRSLYNKLAEYQRDGHALP